MPPSMFDFLRFFCKMSCFTLVLGGHLELSKSNTYLIKNLIPRLLAIV